MKKPSLIRVATLLVGLLFPPVTPATVSMQLKKRLIINSIEVPIKPDQNSESYCLTVTLLDPQGAVVLTRNKRAKEVRGSVDLNWVLEGARTNHTVSFELFLHNNENQVCSNARHRSRTPAIRIAAANDEATFRFRLPKDSSNFYMLANTGHSDVIWEYKITWQLVR
jgi:hypothetical protein